jgi:hypothetical protein
MAVHECRPRFKIIFRLGFLRRVSFSQAIEIRFGDFEQGRDLRNAHCLDNFSNRFCEAIMKREAAGHYSNENHN